MKLKLHERIVNGTLFTTWANPGAIPLSISSALLSTAAGTVIDSTSAVSSGGGYWYAQHQLPGSAGVYVNEWKAQIGSYSYVNRQVVRISNPLGEST